VSLRSKEQIVKLIAPRLPVTIQLSLMSLAITYLVAVPIGIFSAVRQDTWGDYAARSFAIAFLAVPAFWVGTMVMVFPSLWWGWSPPIFLIKFVDDPIGNIKMFILPAFIMGLAHSGGTMRSTRTWMLEVLRQDYIRTAWSKGLRERTVLVRHGFRNTLIPIVTAIGQRMPILIGGAVIIESIFQLPGMGQLLLSAILRRDYTLVSALLLISSAIVVLANLAADLMYGVVDPRIRYR
jgi:peptide/nickel transport system permease protein